MFQFSLRNLLIAVAGCAFGAAALANANSWWLAITWTAALCSRAAAVLLAVFRREEKRAFWSGYAGFGALYVLLLMYSIQPVSSSNSSVLCLQPLSYHNLLTTKLATWTYSRLPAAITTEFLTSPTAPGFSSDSMGPVPTPVPSSYDRYDTKPSGNQGGLGSPMSGGVPVGAMPGMSGMFGMPGFLTANPRFVGQTIYVEVAHALWTLFLASLGGALARWIHKTRGALAPRAEPVRTDAERG